MEAVSLNSACIYGEPKHIIFNNFKGILSSKQPQTITTVQNYYGIIMSTHPPFSTKGNKTVLLSFKADKSVRGFLQQARHT